MKQDGLIEVIELKPLTLKETKLLIDVLIPTDEVSDRFLRYIYTKSDGNPLFIKEIVCQLKKRYEDSSSIQSLFPLGKEGRELFLPPSLSEIVEYRCDRLSGRSKHVMKVGSVIGDVIDLDILTAVAGLEESQLLDEIDTLLEKNLLREGIDERLRFVHPLFREVIYSSLSKLKKRKLHEKTARAIETNRDHDIYKYYLDIALHYEKADMPFFALSNYEKAGNDAKKIRDYRFALDCYDRALKLKGNEEDLLEGKERVETLKNDLEELLDQDELPTIYIKS